MWVSCGHPPNAVDAANSKPFLTLLPERPSSPILSTFEGRAQVLPITFPHHSSPFLAFSHIRAARVFRDHLVQLLVFLNEAAVKWLVEAFSLLAMNPLQPLLSFPPFGVWYVFFHVTFCTLCSETLTWMASCRKAVCYVHLFAFPHLAQISTHKTLNKCLIIKVRLLLKHLEDNLLRECSHGSVFWNFKR